MLRSLVGSEMCIRDRLYGVNDVVYLNVDQPAKAGDKFYVVHISDEVIHLSLIHI